MSQLAVLVHPILYMLRVPSQPENLTRPYKSPAEALHKPRRPARPLQNPTHNLRKPRHSPLHKPDALQDPSKALHISLGSPTTAPCTSPTPCKTPTIPYTCPKQAPHSAPVGRSEERRRATAATSASAAHAHGGVPSHVVQRLEVQARVGGQQPAGFAHERAQLRGGARPAHALPEVDQPRGVEGRRLRALRATTPAQGS